MSAAVSVNIAGRLRAMAAARPDAKAMVFVKEGRTLTFRELDADADRVAAGLRAHGVLPGMRTAVMVRPGPDFFAVAFALFRLGAVPVLIDPGLGRKAFGRCLNEAAPEAFIGIPLAHAARLAFGWAPTARLKVVVGGFGYPGAPTLDCVRGLAGDGPFAAADTKADDTAAILFTSGSTGAPKGAVYTHGNFAAQVELLRERFAIEPGEVDLATFPLFGLFDPALGMTAVIPDMDFTRPGSVEPRNIVGPVLEYGVTNLFGSPALLDRVSRAAGRTKLPSVKRVLSAGAPVSPGILVRTQEMLVGGAQVHTPYGATEALPVAAIGSEEILDETAEETKRGRGTCVGRPVPGVEVSLIKVTDAPLPEWSEDLRAAPGAVGEILVRGPQVTRSYHARPEADALAKVRFPDGSVGHRMGDLGRFDEKGRLWFYGRKSQRVETSMGPMYTDCVEGVFNAHPKVRRSALVGLGERGAQRPYVVVEPEAGHWKAENLRGELLDVAALNEVTKCVADVLFHVRLPTDIRHNAKIQREQLALWAAKELGQ